MSDQPVTLLDRGFALVIAFVLPGLVAMFGIATVNPTVLAWMQGAQAGPTFVGFLFVLLAALALNLVIAALRWYLFEQLKGFPGCPLVGNPPVFDQTKRVTCEAQYIDLRHQHYYYYLAHGNTAVAIPLAVVAWLTGNAMTAPLSMVIAVVVVALFATWILSRAACDAIARFDDRVATLLGVVPPTPSSTASS